MEKMTQDMVSVAQGDLLIVRVDYIPADAARVEPDHADGVVVAHSETGHHHVLERAEVYRMPSSDGLWAEVKERAAVLRHHRSFDTHRPIQLPPGRYKLIRQREATPEGYRRVED